MHSTKSKVARTRVTVEPTRRRGEERVVAVLAAASEVIGEKGFDATTMAEIAQRSGTQIGSLYHFFPNKEAVADALLKRYSVLYEAALREIEEQAQCMSLADLAERLLGFLVELHTESRAVLPLLETQASWSGKRSEFRVQSIEGVARVLCRWAPKLEPARAKAAALVLFQNMKAMKSFALDLDKHVDDTVLTELRLMNRLYLESLLAN